MADITEHNLSADKATQKLTGTSTIEQYDYKLQDKDFSTISKFSQFDHIWEERSTSIEICMKKLHAINTQNVNKALVDNCFKKLKALH